MKARDLFERALTAAGLHVSEGSKLWEAYRKFEQAIFDAIDETDNQVCSGKLMDILAVFACITSFFFHRSFCFLVKMRERLQSDPNSIFDFFSLIVQHFCVIFSFLPISFCFVSNFHVNITVRLVIF